MKKLKHTVSVRLSDEDWKPYQRLLARFGQGSTPSEKFRSFVRNMDFPYESRWDTEDWEFIKSDGDDWYFRKPK